MNMHAATITELPPLDMATTMLGANHQRRPMLLTNSGVDELQVLLMKWILSRRKDDDVNFYCATSFAVFAWGFCAAIAPTLLKQNLEILPIPTPSGTHNFLSGLILRHRITGAQFTILTDYHDQNTTDATHQQPRATGPPVGPEHPHGASPPG